LSRPIFDSLAEVLYHAEAIDLNLVDWIQHKTDAVTGLDAGVLVILIGFVIVYTPLIIAVLWFSERPLAFTGKVYIITEMQELGAVRGVTRVRARADRQAAHSDA